MKPKGFSKKLVFNKVTVSNISNLDMEHVKGGLPKTLTCFPYSYCQRPNCVIDSINAC